MKKIALACGELTVNMEESPFRCRVAVTEKKRGVELIELAFSSPRAAALPQTEITLAMPLPHTVFCWTPEGLFDRHLGPDWAGKHASDMSRVSPQFTIFDAAGRNRMTGAVSDALRRVEFSCGVREEDCFLIVKLRLFTRPEAETGRASVTLCFDRRDVFYADAIRGVTAFFDGFYPPAAVPAAAREPIYSTWYSYHQNLFASELEAECAAAVKLGLSGVIVDDGWQTEDSHRGYAYCGDWEIVPGRFPDMRAHVANVHALGMRYMLWLAVPFVGVHSEHFKIFQDKYLYRTMGDRVGVLDPRFPEVREYLVATYERIVRDWDVDGLKLDFIDNFSYCDEDPAPRENYAGRDCKSIPDGVMRLFDAVKSRLSVLKPELLIEFRQNYVGPAIRKYGNMFRAGDCPADVLSNKVRTIDLRLSCGGAAVHSDMLMFHPETPPAEAALQLLAVLFSTLQISVRAATLTAPQRRMLAHYIRFARAHCATLQCGKLSPMHPELLYPLVYAETTEEVIAVVYAASCAAKLGGAPYCALVNATPERELLAEFSRKGRATVFDCTGRKVAERSISPGLVRVAVPPSGMLEFC